MFKHSISKMNIKTFLLCTLFVGVQIFATEVNYNNYKVYRLYPKNQNQIEILRNLNEIETEFDFWKLSITIGDSTDIAVPPHRQIQFQNFIQFLKLNSTIIIENLQSTIDKSKVKSNNSNKFEWTEFHTLSEINLWLENMAGKYSQFAQIIIGGKSFEGHDIKGLKISFKEGNKKVFIEGGIHAREWVVPEFATYLINELLTSNNTIIREIAESYDWYIFPSVNPDGFIYSHTTDRLWRLNRRPIGDCVGVDLNRNWGYHWNEGGTQPICKEMYPGPYAFSEIETRTLSEYIESIHEDMVIYLSIHSYYQLFLLPYSYRDAPKAENYDELLEIGKKFVKTAYERYGVNYLVGKANEVMYTSSGVSMDWVKGKLNVPLTYSLELRERDINGFILPPEQIIPNCEEILDAIVVLIQEAKIRGY